MRDFSQHRRNDHSHRSSALAQSEGEFPAKLAGHVVMPAESFIDAPADAPADLKAPSKYTTGKRVDALVSSLTGAVKE